ncbi:uncharacterized protein AMSG_09820 [Thecamonas trahens ATCC 50062]|uniref:Uncharacterized protein n=1 Tax=Thecamonas trahens ATCC 50062 TaxID=461836 RepID=A0A0L0DR06_THETB|nr:hypothetical protein AMSG_09820 [Thecamonas trahens ATCC 50062]KNC53868.1 hypothetical protein AMSG_09820 [Thecamonas trahens ATCC 50062]|eukprot:XP_013754248.1 hypothetical protein AMSG_09820 [Thecamonas trahens ATCC 50062]
MKFTLLLWLALAGVALYSATHPGKDQFRTCSDCSNDGKCFCFVKAKTIPTTGIITRYNADGTETKSETEMNLVQTNVHCGTGNDHAVCGALTFNWLIVSPWINVLVLAPVLYRLLFHIGTYKPQVVMSYILKRLGLTLFLVLSRAGLYLVTSGFAFSDHIVGGQRPRQGKHRVEHTKRLLRGELDLKLVVFVYALALTVITTCNAFYTASYFHSYADISTGLLIGAIYPIIAVVALRSGALVYVRPPRSAATVE